MMFLIDWIYDYMNTPALERSENNMIVLQQLKDLSVEKLAAILLIISAYLIIMFVRDIIKRIKRGKKNEK